LTNRPGVRRRLATTRSRDCREAEYERISPMADGSRNPIVPLPSKAQPVDLLAWRATRVGPPARRAAWPANIVKRPPPTSPRSEGSISRPVSGRAPSPVSKAPFCPRPCARGRFTCAEASMERRSGATSAARGVAGAPASSAAARRFCIEDANWPITPTVVDAPRTVKAAEHAGGESRRASATRRPPISDREVWTRRTRTAMAAPAANRPGAVISRLENSINAACVFTAAGG